MTHRDEEDQQRLLWLRGSLLAAAVEDALRAATNNGDAAVHVTSVAKVDCADPRIASLASLVSRGATPPDRLELANSGAAVVCMDASCDVDSHSSFMSSNPDGSRPRQLCWAGADGHTLLVAVAKLLESRIGVAVMSASGMNNNSAHGAGVDDLGAQQGRFTSALASGTLCLTNIGLSARADVQGTLPPNATRAHVMAQPTVVRVAPAPGGRVVVRLSSLPDAQGATKNGLWLKSSSWAPTVKTSAAGGGGRAALTAGAATGESVVMKCHVADGTTLLPPFVLCLRASASGPARWLRSSQRTLHAYATRSPAMSYLYSSLSARFLSSAIGSAAPLSELPALTTLAHLAATYALVHHRSAIVAFVDDGVGCAESATGADHRNVGSGPSDSMRECDSTDYMREGSSSAPDGLAQQPRVAAAAAPPWKRHHAFPAMSAWLPGQGNSSMESGNKQALFAAMAGAADKLRAHADSFYVNEWRQGEEVLQLGVAVRLWSVDARRAMELHFGAATARWVERNIHAVVTARRSERSPVSRLDDERSTAKLSSSWRKRTTVADHCNSTFELLRGLIIAAAHSRENVTDYYRLPIVLSARGDRRAAADTRRDLSAAVAETTTPTARGGGTVVIGLHDGPFTLLMLLAQAVKCDGAAPPPTATL